MPTPDEISAAVKALHERREKSRLGNAPWPVLEAAERSRAMQDYHPSGHAGATWRTEDDGTARTISGNIHGWRPIDTVPDGARVELFLPKGEKGNGEIAVGMVFIVDGQIDHYWTWGGPNSGSDINEAPTHWRYLRPGPDGEYYGDPPAELARSPKTMKVAKLKDVSED